MPYTPKQTAKFRKLQTLKQKTGWINAEILSVNIPT